MTLIILSVLINGSSSSSNHFSFLAFNNFFTTYTFIFFNSLEPYNCAGNSLWFHTNRNPNTHNCYIRYFHRDIGILSNTFLVVLKRFIFTCIMLEQYSPWNQIRVWLTPFLELVLENNMQVIWSLKVNVTENLHIGCF